MEAKAIEAALLRVEQSAREEGKKGEKVPIVLFSDSLSVLAVLQHGSTLRETRTISGIREVSDRLIGSGHPLALQWVPGHVGVKGSKEADALARKGLSFAPYEEPTTYEGAKSLERQWEDRWRADPKGRRVFAHLKSAWRGDPWRKLDRAAQTIITGLRTGHIALNDHLMKIGGVVRDNKCRKCGGESETPDHILFECVALEAKRKTYLGVAPSIEGCLYGSKGDLNRTAQFYSQTIGLCKKPTRPAQRRGTREAPQGTGPR